EKPSSYDGDPENLVPEMDVMDTWATSSVSPQIALDWGNASDEEFDKAFPMTLRLQAHDIIRTWTFYTIVKAKYNLNQIPWKNIMVSGFVLDKNGKKMSKSKGNAIDPVKIMDIYGADAVRYSASAVKLGEDIPFHEKYLQTGKKTITKIFNASKFVHMHLDDFEGGFDYSKLPVIDRWMISRINKVVDEVTSYLGEYEFSKARSTVEQFLWHEFCDYYLEMVKNRLYKPELHGVESRVAGQMTLVYVLERVIKMFALYLPFVTEEIYSWKMKRLENGVSSVHVSTWPRVDNNYFDDTAEHAGRLACDIITAVRRQKNTEQVSQNHPVLQLTVDADKKQRELLEPLINDIRMTVSADRVVFEDAEDIELNNGLNLGISMAEKKESK
ncbi:MAG: class I tRNA ligase family protein, partial [Nanoarchaeota archaeon]